MSALPVISTFAWVPEFARGFVRDLRPRWAFEEVGQPYEVELLQGDQAKQHDYRQWQPFGQVPAYRDDSVAMFESGAIVLRIVERAGKLLPTDPAARARAVQWVVAALNSVEPYVMGVAMNDIFEANEPWSAARGVKVREYLHGRLTDLANALGDDEWLDGGDFTAGDLMMVSVLGGLRGTGLLDAHPTLVAYVARGEARPAHGKAMADHLATFEKVPA